MSKPDFSMLVVAYLASMAPKLLSRYEESPRAWRRSPWQRKGLGGRVSSGRDWDAYIRERSVRRLKADGPEVLR